MTNQPEWKYLANLGDVDYINHGGAFVFEDTTGVYDPDLEIFEPSEDGLTITVYRICLDKCYQTKGVLSDNKYHKNKPAWFAKYVEDFDNEGVLEQNLAEMLCSDEAVTRACGYMELIQYYGPYQFDQYPLELTVEEAEARAIRNGVSKGEVDHDSDDNG